MRNQKCSAMHTVSLTVIGEFNSSAFKVDIQKGQNWIILNSNKRILKSAYHCLGHTGCPVCCNMNKNILCLNFSSDRPDPPASQPVVSKLTTQSLVLSWMGPSFDGGTAVLGYIVEVREEGLDRPGSWTEVTNQCKNTCYHIRSGLEPLGQYCFRVRAYNSEGISEPSRESECVKMVNASELYGVFAFERWREIVCDFIFYI